MKARFVRPGALDVVSGVLVLAALAFLARRGGERVPSRSPSVIALSNTPSPVAGLDSTATMLVARNVFSATRRAPTVRFTPPGSDMGAPSASSAQSTPSNAYSTAIDTSSARTAARSDAAPHLYGIVTEDGVRRALLLLSTRGEPPRLFAVGEGSSGFRVVLIGEDRVVLASSIGSRTLRLVSRATRDSLENLP